MRITYDPKVDAAYIYLSGNRREPETVEFDEDINLDFDAGGRLLGVEVLDASRRLDLGYLWGVVEEFGEQMIGWPKLHHELLRLKQANLPVETKSQRVKNWIKEVGDDFVILVSERSPKGKPRTITRDEIDDLNIEKHIGKRRIIIALRELAGHK